MNFFTGGKSNTNFMILEYIFLMEKEVIQETRR